MDLTVLSATPTEVDLSWTNNASSTTPVFIERSDDGGTDYAIIDMVSGTTGVYADTSVTDGTSLLYKIGAVSQDGYNANLVTSSATAAPVMAPTGLSATPNGQNEIDLSWNNPSQTATGYTIQRSRWSQCGGL
jgi:fibronectin type 3 domain-containing protein